MDKIELSSLGSAKKVWHRKCLSFGKGTWLALMWYLSESPPDPNQPSSPSPLHQVTLTKDDTIILHGGGQRELIQERCDSIRQSIEGTTSDYDRWVWGDGRMWTVISELSLSSVNCLTMWKCENR